MKKIIEKNDGVSICDNNVEGSDQIWFSLEKYI